MEMALCSLNGGLLRNTYMLCEQFYKHFSRWVQDELEAECPLCKSENFISELRYIESPRAILLKPIIVAYVQHSSSSNSSFVWALVL